MQIIKLYDNEKNQIFKYDMQWKNDWYIKENSWKIIYCIHWKWNENSLWTKK